MQFPILVLALLTSFVQARVFSLLTCIYISLQSHHDSEHEGHGHSPGHGHPGIEQSNDDEPVRADEPDLAAPPLPIADVGSPVSEPRGRTRHNTEAQSPSCVAHRQLAESAQRGGDWEALERLAQRHTCWVRASEAKALQLRSLFELERFHECIRLGAKGGSKEIKKWASNCQRALE